MIRVLFVCTGNTCRSPMAMAVFNNSAKERGLEYSAKSCGLFADGSPISYNSKRALSDAGIELEHISTPVCEDLLREADYVFGITDKHAKSIISLFPEFTNKVYSFPLNVFDPYGGDISVYRECLNQIKTGVDSILKVLTEKENG